MRSVSFARRIYLTLGATILAGVAISGTLIAREAHLAHVYETVIAQPLEARRLGLVTQVLFKRQVQEWKDILLRGHKPDALAKYTGQFHDKERAVLATIDSVQHLTRDPVALALADSFATEHKALSVKYAAALDAFTAMAGKNYTVADSMVAGQDRAASTHLDRLAERLSAASTEAVTAERAASARERLVCIVAGLGLFAALGWLCVVIVRKIAQPLALIAEVAQSVALGDISRTVTYESADEIGVLAQSFRAMLSYLREAAAAADAMRRGDAQVEIQPRSDNDALSISLASLRVTLDAIGAETHRFQEATRRGDLGVRSDPARFEGSHRTQIVGMNTMLDGIAKPLTEAAAVLHRLADRDLSARMTGDYAGAYGEMRDSINMAATNLDETLT